MRGQSAGATRLDWEGEHVSERWRQQATWRISAELASGAKGGRVVQVGSYVPGDYALAVVATDLGQFATVSMAQGLQITGPQGGASRSWAQVRSDGPEPTARKVLRALGLSGERRPTTRRRRTYRVIASLLEAQGSAPERWDVLMGSLLRPVQSSASVVAASVAGQHGAAAPAPASIVPDPWSVLDVRGLAGADMQDVWALGRNGVGVMALHDGVAWFPTGSPIDLMRHRSDRESTVATELIRRAFD